MKSATLLFPAALLALLWILPATLCTDTGEFALSPDMYNLLHAPWTLMSYSFIHDGAPHLAVNIIALFASARLLRGIASPVAFLCAFFGGSLLGALLYMVAAVSGISGMAPLAGASAGVMALLAVGLLRRKRPVLFGLLLLLALCSGAVAPHIGGCLAGILYVFATSGGASRSFSDLRLVAFRERRVEALLCKVASSGYKALSAQEKNELDSLTRKSRKRP